MHRTNVHGFGDNNDVKTEQMIKKIEELSIDMIMISMKQISSGTLELLTNC